MGAGRVVWCRWILVASAGEEIRPRCATAEFAELEAEETQFLPGASGQWGYGERQVVSWPYYGLGTGGMGLGNMNAGPQMIIRDRILVGDVQVRRGEHVTEPTDIGRVQGLVVDPADHHVTDVLLDEGHLWGRKEVAIPVGPVTGVADGVRLSLSKDEVADLSPVELDHAD